MIIFDCDGVLVDSELIEHAVDVELLALHGYHVTAEALLRRFVGIARRDMYPTVFAELGKLMPDGMLDEREARVWARCQDELPVIAGVRAALDGLRDVAKCVASSSTPEKLAMKLEVACLTADFAPHIFSTALVARGKPAPDIYLHAAAALKVAPRACVVVEDSPHGVAGAKTAGMQVIGFIGGCHATPRLGDELRAAGADHVVSDMAELPAVVRPMLS